MKNAYIGLIGALLMGLTSCKKNREKVIIDNSLIAVWQWTHSTGGIYVHTIYPSSTRIVSLRFYSDSTYTVNVNLQTTQHGTYSLYSNGNYPVVHFDKPIIADKLFIDFDQTVSMIENGKLLLYDYNVGDGFGHFFDRVN